MEHKGHKDCATFCQFLPFQWFSYRIIAPKPSRFYFRLQICWFLRNRRTTHTRRTSFLKAACETTKKYHTKWTLKKTSLPSRTTPNLSKLSMWKLHKRNLPTPESRKSFRRDVQPWSWQVWMQLHQRPHCFAEDWHHNRVLDRCHIFSCEFSITIK